jgi:class 3 adenylate cyclase
VLNEPVRGGLPDPAFYSLPGLEQWRAFQDGRAPHSSLHRLTGFRLTQVDPGLVVLALPRPEWLQFGDGTVDLSVLIELASAGAATTVTDADHAPQMTAVSVQHLRPATIKAGIFSAKARVLNVGPRFVTIETGVEDGFGREVSRTLASAVIRPLDPAPPKLAEPLRPMEEPAYATPDPYLRPVPRDLVPSTDDIEESGGWPELIRAWSAGRAPLPPVIQLLGISCLGAEAGVTRWSMRAGPWLRADRPHVQGGTILTLVRSASTSACGTLCGPGRTVTVVSESLTYLHPVMPDGTQITAQASARADGDLLSTSTEVTGADGRALAVGSQTALLGDRRDRTEAPAPRRALLTVVFTDIVDSTRQAESLGDTRWRRLLDEHHAVIRKQLELFGGREVKTTGDGFLVTFDAPGRALECSEAIRDGVARLGLEIRIGMHSGECEISGPDIAGIAVHIASRIQQLAGPGEITVSGTVRDLVAGARFRFKDRGSQPLKGVEGDWRLFSLQT